MEPFDTPCELCGDVTPSAALHEDPDQGWEALCAVCWALQQPPDPDPVPQVRRLGRPAEADEEEEW